MPTNEEEYIKSWMTQLHSGEERHRPMHVTHETLGHNVNPSSTSHPLNEMFKLPVPWRKRDEITPHITKVNNTVCLEIEPQDGQQDCPHSCLCKKVIEVTEEEDYDNEPPFPGIKPGHCPKAEMKDICSCKQVIVQPEPCPSPPTAVTGAVLFSGTDHSSCTCPRVPLPLVTPEPKLQRPIHCECVEKAQQQAPTFYKCMQEKRQVNIARLFSQKDEPKPLPEFTIAAATQVELDDVNESKTVPSITDFSEKSKKSESSGKESIIADLIKSKQIQSDFTVATAKTKKSSLKESSYKDKLGKKEKKKKLSSEESSTTSSKQENPRKTPFAPIKETFSEQESVKANKSCSTDSRYLKRKKTSKMNPRSSYLMSRPSKVNYYDMSNSTLSLSSSKTTKISKDKNNQNMCQTYFMDQSISSSSEIKSGKKRRPKYVDVDDIDKVKAKDREEMCEFKFDNPENMQRIKEIIEKETQDCKTRLKLAYVDGMYPGFHAGHKTCCLPYMYVPKNMSWLYNTCEGAGITKPDLGWRPGSIRADVASIMAIVKKGKPQPEFSNPLCGIRKVEDKARKVKQDDGKLDKSESLDGEGYACLAEVDIYKKRAVDDGQQLVTVFEEEKEEPPKDLKPTLHMHKTHGKYFVTLHPAGKSKEGLKSGKQNNVLLTFDRKALDTEGGSDSDDDDDTTTVTDDSMELDFTSALGMFRRKDPKVVKNVQTAPYKFK